MEWSGVEWGGVEWDGVKEEALSLLRKAAGWACRRTTALGGEGPRAALGAWPQRQSATLPKTTVAAFKAAAEVYTTWKASPVPGLEEVALEVFTSAEALATVAA